MLRNVLNILGVLWLALVLFLLFGCTKTNPNLAQDTNPGADMTEVTVDMAGTSIPDMANAPDMLAVDTLDMAQTSGDMAQNVGPDMASSNDMAQAAQPDMTQLPDMSGPVVYTHHDTFCSDSWTDNNPTVNPQIAQTAMDACSKCCADVTGSACSCTDHPMTQVGGYAATVSYMSFNANGFLYWFYYYDSNFQLKSGKGEQWLPGRGLINSTLWDQ